MSRTVYNSLFSDEKWEKVNAENKKILDELMDDLKQKGKAEGTICGYFQDLRMVMIHIMEQYENKYFYDLSDRDFRNIILWTAEDCGMSINRTRRIRASINNLLNFNGNKK